MQLGSLPWCLLLAPLRLCMPPDHRQTTATAEAWVAPGPPHRGRRGLGAGSRHWGPLPSCDLPACPL